MRRARGRRAAGAAGALCLAALATAAAAACSGSPHRGGGGSASPRPQPQQAQAVARQEFGLLAGGGWAQAWDLWTTRAQQSITRADFVRLNTDCRPALGVPYVIEADTVTGTGTVRIDWRRADATGSDTVLYQAGRWRFEPDAGSLADYRLGVAALVQRRRAAGSCR